MNHFSPPTVNDGVATFDCPADRSRIAWWVLTAALAGALVLAIYSLVGSVVLGLFLYYGTRPIDRTVRRKVAYPGVAAGITIFLIAIPVLVLIGIVLVVGGRQLALQGDLVESLLGPFVDLSAFESDPVGRLVAAVRNPAGNLRSIVRTATKYLGLVATMLGNLFVAVLLAFYLLKDGDRIAAWFRSEVDSSGAAHAYVTAVDRDLETVYFSNVVLVVLIGGLSLVVYHSYNFLAPAAVTIPMPTVLALLTGFASLVPLVVGKIVYLPLVGYLGFVAAGTTPGTLVYPVGLLVLSFVVLDFVPMTFLLPALAGRSTDMGLIMFAYVVGVMLYGWYGLFLGPLLVVLGIQLVRIVFTELIHGEAITPAVRAADDIGSDPTAAGDRDD